MSPYSVAAAKALLLREGEVLLVQHDVYAEKIWSFPGGKIERGELPEEALQREMIEEVGLSVAVHEPVGTLRLIAPSMDSDIIAIVYQTSVDEDSTVDFRQSDPGLLDYRWVDVGELSSIKTAENLPELVQRTLDSSSGYNYSHHISSQALLDHARRASAKTRKTYTVQQSTEKTHIGAAVVTSSGEVFTGALVETRDRVQTTHAERAAIVNASLKTTDPVTAIAIYSTAPNLMPCGSCLQLLYEFSGGNDRTRVITEDPGGVNEHSLAELYPQPWPDEVNDE